MTEIAYTRQGDYNLPNLTLPAQPKVELGMYAQMRRRFLKEHHKILYYNLLTKCKLIENLYETEQTALKMENDLIRQMAQDQGVTEQLKAQDQITWVRRMNSICNRVEEIVQAELIFV